MNNKSSIISLIVVAIIAISIPILGKPVINVSSVPTPVTVNVPEQKAPIVNVTAPEVNVPPTVVNLPKQSTTLGAVTGPDLFFPYTNNNGIRTNYVNIGATPWASTTCTYLVAATSTLEHFSFHATQLASSTMAEIGYDTSGSPMATTTSLGKATWQTGGGALVASTTAAFKLTLTPGTRLNVKVGENGASGTSPKIAGICKIVTRELQNN